MPRANPERLRSPEGLDDLLLYRLSRLQAVAGSMVVRVCEGRYGITRREWRLLALLVEQPGLQPSQLADKAGLDRARTSRAVGSLVDKHLVERIAGIADRRQATLQPTERGLQVAGEMFPLVRDLNAELLAALDDGAVAVLDAALVGLQEKAQRMAAEAVLPKADRRRGKAARGG